jgi:glycosyltransferase involved in cell wall biosynthesis
LRSKESSITEELMISTSRRDAYFPTESVQLEPGSTILPADSGQIKILHIINDLSVGGAEMMLYKLLSGINRERFDPAVISLIDRGKLRESIEGLGIPVYTAGMKPGIPTPASILRLIRLTRRLKPDLIQGWMYHSCLAGQLAKTFAARTAPLLWGIHCSDMCATTEKKMTLAMVRICAPLSRRPDRIVFVSQSSRSQHENFGYNIEKSCVLPNGIDTRLFAPSAAARLSVRCELGLPGDAFLIGLVGRYHPMKDHNSFLQAAALLLKDYPQLHFLLIGRGVNSENRILQGAIRELGLPEQIHLLGERSDTPRLGAALDIFTLSSSYGESFPNVIGEAMACAVPCVVTDVGDAAWIIGDTGRVVPRRDPHALAAGWRELIALGEEERQALGRAARLRVMEHFPLESVVAQYEALYEKALAETRAGVLIRDI